MAKKRYIVIEPQEDENIIDILTEITLDTEGLLPGQTPLRKTNKKMSEWSTIQGIPVDTKAQIPKDRQNFFFVDPGQRDEVIRRQWRSYFNNPEKFGAETLEDAIRTFDQSHPENKIKRLKEKGIDPSRKLREFNISLRDFLMPSAEATEPTAEDFEAQMNQEKQQRELAKALPVLLQQIQEQAKQDPNNWTYEQTAQFFKDNPAQTPDEEAQREYFLTQKKQQKEKSKLGIILQEYDKQLTDLLNTPARILGLPAPPLQSELATKTIPAIGETILRTLTAPLGPYKIPPATLRNIKNLLTGKGPTEIVEIEPTLLDIGWYAAIIGYPAFQNVISRQQWNIMMDKLIATEKFKGIVMENMPAIEQYMAQAGIKLPANLPIEDKVQIVMQQAKQSPTLGDVLIGLEKGTIMPKAPMKAAPMEAKATPTTELTGIAPKPTLPEETFPYALQPATGGMLHIGKPILKEGEKLVGRGAPIRITKPTTITLVSGEKVTLPPGEEYTPYKIADAQGNVKKIILQDGGRYVVQKSQAENVERQNIVLGEKEFMPEAKEIKETIRGKPSLTRDEIEEKVGWIENYNIPVSQDMRGLLANGKYIQARDYLRDFREEFQRQLSKEDYDKVSDLIIELDTKGSAAQESKFSSYTLPGGEEYREILLQAEPKGEIKTVTRKVGGENRYNLAGLPLQPISVPFGKRSNFEGQGFKMTFQELSPRIPKSMYNSLKWLEEFKGVQWTDAYAIPYQVGNRNTQKTLIKGKSEVTGGTIDWEVYRNPGNLTGPGSTIVYIDGNRMSMVDAIGKDAGGHWIQVRDYPRETLPGVATRQVTLKPLPFTGGHWQEKNVFAHLRIKDRTTPEGKKVYFLEEIQSDWMLAQRRGTAKAGEIPFKNWEEVALKRILKEAIEGGYDYISWTTGKQQADRYNLAKYIDEVQYGKYYRKRLGKDEEYYTIRAIKNDRVMIQKDLTAEELPEFIGKDIADKIIRGEGHDLSRQGVKEKILSTPDLQLGGEWAINLYDKVIPNILKDLTKGEIIKIKVDQMGKQETQPAMMITTNIRAHLGYEQPMAGGKGIKPPKKPPEAPPTTGAEGPFEEEIERAGEEELKESKNQLRKFLTGKLKPSLRAKGDYVDIDKIPWLWSESEEKGITPDQLTELKELGFPVENEDDIVRLIENYFAEDIQAGWEKKFEQNRKTYEAEQKQLIKPQAPITIRPKETGVGTGTLLNSSKDTDRGKKAVILSQMPFTLLGNKAEVLSRLSSGLKIALTRDIEEVYDLFGGAKGYRVGLFSNLPSEKYHLNELSDERNAYYNNIKDPAKVQQMKDTIKELRERLRDELARAFGIDPAKYTPDDLNRALNKWLQRGQLRERYQFTKEIIQDFGDKLLAEAQTDKFQSPRSSAIYYFLENTSIFGIGPEGWTQGIIRTAGEKSEIRDSMTRLGKAEELLNRELNRDKNMEITKEDAWAKMDQLTQDLLSGKIDPSKTVVLVDPQYLNPTEKAGTYTVGQPDTAWEGHKQNLEQHLLPLIDTGVRIIYTNNDDINLENWLKEQNLPYNIEEKIGMVAQKGGRDEIISFINYALPEEYTAPKRAHPGEYEPGAITGESERFKAWYAKRERERRALERKKEVIRRFKRTIGMHVEEPRRPPTPAEEKVIAALKQAKDIRNLQEAFYTQARAQKLARSLGIGRKVKGEKGFYAEKGALRGELPKVEYESIRNKITQEDIDSLFIEVKESPNLDEWEKISAREGLAKLFGQAGGAVPRAGEMKLLGQVFSDEFIRTLMSKRALIEKTKYAIGQLINMPRSIMASFDLSAPFRQGAFLIGRPKQFWSAFARMFGYFRSEKAYNGLRESIVKDSLWPLAKESRLSLTEMSAILELREEKFMSNWAEKLPIIGRTVRASGRAYMGFLNKLRFDVFKDLVTKAKIAGLDPEKNRRLSTAIAQFVNTASGRGSIGALENAATTLNGVFFSPRLMASRLSLLNPIYYVRQDPFVRKEALKSLFAFIAAGLTYLGLMRLAGAKVKGDPRSADFGKARIKNTRTDPWAGFQQYVRMAAQIITGKYISSYTNRVIRLGEGYKPLTRYDILLRQIESKEAPVLSFVTTLLKGQGPGGEKIDIPKEIADRFTPMVIQDLIDIAKESPELLPIGLLGIFGVGVQTYKKKRRFEIK